MGNEDKDFKIEFLYKALDDCQNIIRFTDTKAAAVIGFWTFFITITINANNLWVGYLKGINHWTELTFLVLLILFMSIFLVCSIFLAYKALVPKNNPEKHIDYGEVELKKIFYLHEFNMPLKSKQLFKNDTNLKLGKKTRDYVNDFKCLKENDVHKELIFELQKTSFIRNLKVNRVNESVSLLLKFLVLLGVIFVYFIGKEIFAIKGGSALIPFDFNVALFIVLYIGHKIGDYLFQTNYQAINKSDHWSPLLKHCTVYTSIVLGMAYIFTGFFNWLAVVVLFISHVVIDNKKLLLIWGKYIKGIKNPEQPNEEKMMLELDQSFHYIILFFISFM